ncbi:MAG TPA: hypothetical protein VH591_21390 [Ktedonobacterales bacterium]|jgi:hypothetical protein
MAVEEMVEYKGYTPREVRVALAQHNLKYTDMARRCSTSGTNISLYLNNKLIPGKLLRIQIAEFMEDLEREPLPEEVRPEPVLVPRVRGVR